MGQNRAGDGHLWERQRNPDSLHETRAAPGGWAGWAVPSTGHQHSREAPSPVLLGVHQAISRVSDYFLEQ